VRPRIRTIKPEAHTDEALWDLEVETGLPIFRAFLGLWAFADFNGRFEWRPRALKAGVLPYWDGDFAVVLDALTSAGFVIRYEVDGKTYGVVRTFTEHQVINKRERDAGSTIPAPPESLPDPVHTTSCPTPHVHARAEHVQTPAEHVHARVEGNGREGKGTEGNSRARARARDDTHDPEPPEPDDRPPIERARSTLSRGYAERYERLTAAPGATKGDPWMGQGANGQAIREVAAWCAAVPEQAVERAEAVLRGMFADPWLGGVDPKTGKHRRWPWGPVAKDPAKYADLAPVAGPAEADAAERLRRAAERDRETFARMDAADREAVPPPPDILASITGGSR
jgi:hypothetical protein